MTSVNASAKAVPRQCHPDALEHYVCDVLCAAGTPRAFGEEVAHHLVRSNLSGHDSHGVIRLPQYVSRIRSGEVIPDAAPAIVRETPSTVLIDAGYGFGQVAVYFAVRWAEEHAALHGLAAAAVRHCTHTGRLGDYMERVAGAGKVGLLTVGAAGPGVGGMVLPGTSHRYLGANPWVFGIPTSGGDPIVVDMSSSMIAQGKIPVAEAEGRLLPPDTLVDAEGRPSQDPAVFSAGGGLMPLGGSVAGHKGYGLALASALFGGLSMIDDPQPSLIGASVDPAQGEARGRLGGVFLAVLDPGVFGAADAYRAMASATVDGVRALRAPDGAEVLVPGDPESRARKARASGVQLPLSLCRDFERLGQEYGVSTESLWKS
jgi:LDH2 family malate/lactate/ureidoglycolate dehydrogenase